MNLEGKYKMIHKGEPTQFIEKWVVREAFNCNGNDGLVTAHTRECMCTCVYVRAYLDVTKHHLSRDFGTHDSILKWC
jgi:hypothetical protein